METDNKKSAMANLQRDLDYFIQLHEYRRGDSRFSQAKVWDERAAEWEQDYRSMGKGEERITRAAEYLRYKGLLGPDCDVVDIGCGPGRFVAEFARTARSVVGMDISMRMTEYGAAYAAEQGLDNVNFKVCDFQQLDVDGEGLAGKFDLVFSSITPAIKGMNGLEKMMKISRAYCYNSTFVHSENKLTTRMMPELFGRPAPVRWDGHWFYAMFNLLFLMGYYPEVTYYKRRQVERIAADEAAAARYAETLLPNDGSKENMSAIRSWLEREADSDGKVEEERLDYFACFLWVWDVRDRTGRPVQCISRNGDWMGTM